MSWLHILAILLIAGILSIYIWITYKYLYFRWHKIPFIPPTKFLGNLTDIILFKNNPTLAFADLYNQSIAKTQSFIGIFIFHKPALLIRDPELIKRIFVKDFNYFSNRGARADQQNDKLGTNSLFLIKNPEWKNLRSNLSTFFTGAKLKQMFNLIKEAANELDIHLCNISNAMDPDQINSDGIEIKEICSCYTTDVIASVAFGIKTNAIQNRNCQFRHHGAHMMKFNWRRAIEASTIFLLPELVPFIKSKIFSKESSAFLRNAINFIMDERKKTGLQRNDLIDLLIKMEHARLQNGVVDVDNDVLVAQAAIFFSAGFETSASAISFALYELAKNIPQQERVRAEIQTILHKYNDDISYDCILEMEYLTAIVYETTRLYPTLPFLDRECTPPDGVDGYSLKPFSDFVVPKGMVLYTPIYPIHRNPLYFPNPDTFNPDRFLAENKSQIIPYTYFGFGLGPHNCVGERLGILQVKLGLVNILKNHFVRPTSETPLTLEYDKKAFILQPKNKLYLHIFKDPLNKK